MNFLPLGGEEKVTSILPVQKGATWEALSFSASSPVPQWNYDSHTWSTRTIWTA